MGRSPRRHGESSMISDKTTLVAHIGYPTEAFKAPMIYNPYFEQAGAEAVGRAMGVKGEAYGALLRALLGLTNNPGGRSMMTNKSTTVGLVRDGTPKVKNDS